MPPATSSLPTSWASAFAWPPPPPKEEPNIENTLVAASIEGIVREDFRVLALLVDWIGIHVDRVNMDRLTKLVAKLSHKSVKAFWAGIARWQSSDPRMKKLLRVYRGPRIALFLDGGEFLVQRHGEDKRFSGSSLIVPAKTLRERTSDIESPSRLAKRHKCYYWRILIGPTFRADIWAVLNANQALTPSEIARRAYGSFPTAWKARRDWKILHP